MSKKPAHKTLKSEANHQQPKVAKLSKGHTPTPWHLHDMEMGMICIPGGLSIVDCNASMLEASERKANAAFIVKAVNEYQELVNFVKRVAAHRTIFKEEADFLIAKAEGRNI